MTDLPFLPDGEIDIKTICQTLARAADLAIQNSELFPDARSTR